MDLSLKQREMSMAAWDWIDYIIIGIIALSVMTGLFRGFFKELIALCVWILAIWLAMTYSPVVNGWLQPHIQDNTIRVIVSFVSILLVTILLGGLVNALLSFILRRSGLSGTDRLLGMGFGFVRGVFIVGLLMLIFHMTSIDDKKYTSQSVLYPKFEPLVNLLNGYMPVVMQHIGGMDKNKKEQPIQLDTKDIKPGSVHKSVIPTPSQN